MTERYTTEQLFKILAVASQRVKAGATYEHKSRGSRYIVVATTLLEDNLEPAVIYAPLDAVSLGLSLSFTRPITEFCDRFEEVLE